MPHLLKPRKGWENERLASYLLSRFSFVAHPTSIADDLGSDFFCTIFEIESSSEGDVLVPRSSFAIQIKSSSDKIGADNKIGYFMRLELPFFVGVMRQHPAEMDIYSAEFLPLLFSEVGQPQRLSLVPVKPDDFDPNYSYERVEGSSEIRLKCPLIATLRVEDDRSSLTAKVVALLRICKRTQSNIASRVSEEHIYQLDDSGHYRIVAGPGSAMHFRLNFLKRLGEVFYNLFFILGDAAPDQHLSAEIQLFEALYREIAELQGYGPTLPEFVSVPYGLLRSKLARHAALGDSGAC